MKTISTKTVKERTLKINEFALKSTEKMVLTSINKTSDLQKFTAIKLKDTLKFTAKQQDNFFENAEKAKVMVWRKLNKTLDFFSKN